MTSDPTNIDADKQAYLKAQKQRNIFIGLGLAAFVVIIFFVSMARMAQGLHRDSVSKQVTRAEMAASSSQAAVSQTASAKTASSH